MSPVAGFAGRCARLLAVACTAAATTATATTLGAQTAAPPGAHNPFGVIAGIVVDSLHGGTLKGAQISVEGLNVMAMTDSTGRFRIDSVPPGKYRMGIFHPLLDSLALSIASPPLPVAADSTLTVVFATPSTVTLLRLVCGEMQIDTLNGIGPSLVVGRALDAESEAPVAGIHVTLSWTEIQASAKIGVHRVQRTRDTTTGPSGEFRFCHLPANLDGVARAVSTKGDTSAVIRPLALHGRLVVPLVLHVPGGPPAATGTHGSASSGGATTPALGSVLTGRVMRSDGTGPMPGAQVMVLGSKETAVTNDSGGFTLRGLPAGSRTLAVRALGWEPVTMAVDLSVHEPRQVVVPLAMKTGTLQAVVVTATLNAGMKRVGFESRKHTGIGHFVDPDDIEKRSPFEFVDIMDNMPGVMRRPGPFGEDYLTGTRGAGGCVRYVVDDVPYVETTRGDINTFLPPAQVGAIEVYQPSETPAQYSFSPPVVVVTTTQVTKGSRSAGTMGTTGGLGSGLAPASSSGGTGCVKILIWTKAKLGLVERP
jgi:hypothetical protein